MTLPIDTTHSSPNQGTRGGVDISMIVLHATVGSYASALAWLTNPASRVSTHYLIRKDGFISQLVSDGRCAFHAGRALWHGARNINERSIGIELENANNGRDPYPPKQLAAAHNLCRVLIAKYNIERGDVTRHLDVAMPRGRKTDPAGLPWPIFADSLYLDDPDPPFVEHVYKVRDTVTAGATIRSAPRTNAGIVGHLKAGDVWIGEAVPGQLVYVSGFGSSNIWIRSTDQRHVWSGLLMAVASAVKDRTNA